MKDLVRLHNNNMAWTKAEYNRLLLIAIAYKAVGKIIIATAIVLAMALINTHLG